MNILNFFTADTPIWLTAILFGIGLLLIIKGGDMFVAGACKLAEAMKIPKFIIGATIVSIATTMPEMIVSVAATAKGNADMAVGNAVGSVTANTALIMALFAICMPFKIRRREFLPKGIIMILSSAATYILLLLPKGIIMILSSAAIIAGCMFTPTFRHEFVTGENNEYHTLSTAGTVVLIVLFAVFFAENIMGMKKGETSPIVSDSEDKTNYWTHTAMFVSGGAGIVIGANLLVNSGTMLAEDLGISQRVISVIAVAIGTSLPELVTTITALKKKEASLSAGNILGANIIDLTLILPVCSLVSERKYGMPLAVATSSVSIDMVACLGAVIIAVVPTIISKKFSRIQGIMLMAGYCAYIYFSTQI